MEGAWGMQVASSGVRRYLVEMRLNTASQYDPDADTVVNVCTDGKVFTLLLVPVPQG